MLCELVPKPIVSCVNTNLHTHTPCSCFPAACLGSNSNTTVDIKGVACNVAGGFIQSQKAGHTSNFRGLAETLQGDDFGNLGKVGFVKNSSHLWSTRGRGTQANVVSKESSRHMDNRGKKTARNVHQIQCIQGILKDGKRQWQEREQVCKKRYPAQGLLRPSFSQVEQTGMQNTQHPHVPALTVIPRVANSLALE